MLITGRTSRADDARRRRAFTCRLLYRLASMSLLEAAAAIILMPPAGASFRQALSLIKASTVPRHAQFRRQAVNILKPTPLL